MQEKLIEFLSEMQTAHLVGAVHEKWRNKAVEFIVGNELYKKPHLIEPIIAICEENAQAEISNITDNIKNLHALLEADAKQQEEKTEAGVH